MKKHVHEISEIAEAFSEIDLKWAQAKQVTEGLVKAVSGKGKGQISHVEPLIRYFDDKVEMSADISQDSGRVYEIAETVTADCE
jgi:hypothetical protein